MTLLSRTCKTIGLTVAVAAIVLILPARANAGLVLTLDSGTGGDVQCFDNDISCDANPLVGAITFVGSLGNWTVNVQTATSNAPGTTNLASLHLTSTLQASAADTLLMLVSDQFTAPTGPGTLVFSSTGNGADIPGGSFLQGIAAKTNDVDGAFLITPLCSYSIAVPPTGGNFPGCVESVGHGDITPYTMLLFQGVSVSGATGSFSIDTTASNQGQIPEPASMALFGLGLSTFGTMVARRRRKAGSRS